MRNLFSLVLAISNFKCLPVDVSNRKGLEVKKMQKERIENWELKREGNRVENANVRLNSFDILH